MARGLLKRSLLSCLPCMGIDLVVKSKGVVVRQGLKEAGGKIAGLRTETAYKACMMDESA